MIETGRKFWVTIFAMLFMMMRPDVASELAAVAIAFTAGNAYVTAATAGLPPKASPTEE